MFGILVALLMARSAAELFAEVTLGPLHFNVPSVVGVLMIGLAALYFLVRKRPAWNPLSTGWAVWLVLLLPSVAVSFVSLGRPGLLAVREWVRLLSIAAVFYLAYALSRENPRRDGIRLLFLGLIFPLGAAFLQLIFHSGMVLYGQQRVMGTMTHPNSLAQFLILFLGLTYNRARPSFRIPWIALLVAELAVLLATLNIGAFLMAAVLVGWIFIRENRRGRALLLGLGVLFGLLFLANRNAQVKMKMFESLAPAKIAKSIQPFPDSSLRAREQNASVKAPVFQQRYRNSVSFRFGNWAQLVRLWEEKPWLGHGLQTTGLLNPYKDENGNGYSPHNDFIRYLFESGVFGLLAYCGFLAFSAIRIAKAVRGSPAAAGPSLPWVLAGVFLAWQIGSLADNMISTTAFQFFFWAAWGFVLGRRGESAPVASAPPAVP